MYKSKHVIYHQNKLKRYREWKNYKYYKKVLHRLKQFELVRFPRRVAIWKAMILQCGGRSKIV